MTPSIIPLVQGLFYIDHLVRVQLIMKLKGGWASSAFSYSHHIVTSRDATFPC